MRMIFEQDIENSDFLEFIISPEEIDSLLEFGLIADYPPGLFGLRNLNVFIRMEKEE